MIISHDIFVCKPGNASKMAKLFKEWADLEKKRDKDITILTDMTGQFHRVLVVSSHENLSAYEANLKDQGDTPEHKALMEKFGSMNEMYLSGSREIFKVW